MTWYWAALIGLAAWLSPFLVLGAVGAWVTHRRHKTARRSIWQPARPYDWAGEFELQRLNRPPLDEHDVELWCRQLNGPQADAQIERELNVNG